MSAHLLRPVYVVLAVVALILVARAYVVPEDFGVYERGYMYGWHRKGNEQDWKDFKVKYRGRLHCQACHPEKIEQISTTPHAEIQCENCHGPATDHPSDPERLDINRTRAQCLRCHADIPDKDTGRAAIPSIKDGSHNPGTECVLCHNPHSTGFG